MSQEQPTVKKRSLTVLALAAVCVLLGASLAGVIAFYRPAQSDDQQAEIDELNQQIAILQLQLDQTVNPSTYLSQIAALKSQVESLNASLAALYEDATTYQQIASLQKVGVLYTQQTFTQNGSTTTLLWSGTTSYAGYIVVDATSTSDTTYAQLTYTFGTDNFSFNQTIGASGNAVFPVLPTAQNTVMELKIGNTLPYGTNANVTATANFYY